MSKWTVSQQYGDERVTPLSKSPSCASANLGVSSSQPVLQRFLTVWLLVFFMFGNFVPCWAQSGIWKFLFGNLEPPTTEVRWRTKAFDNPNNNNHKPLDPAPPYKHPDNSPIEDRKRTFGIHVALIPLPINVPDRVAGQTVTWPRGSMLFWGRGVQKDVFPGGGVYASWTPFLLWHPQFELFSREVYGYIGYLKDPVVDTNRSDRFNNANLFCAGHCPLDDGRLFVAGGHYDVDNEEDDDLTDGLTAAYIFDPNAGWLESSNWGWSIQPVGKHENEQGQLVNGMSQKRWYPTLLTVPNVEFPDVGTVPFVVFIGGGLQSNGPAVFTTTFEMFDPRPSIERFYWYSLPTDQQEFLGEGYPQLHLISWFPNPLDPTYEEARVVYVGHETPIFAWNPKNPGTPGTTYIWDRRDIPGRVERPNSASVLLPRMDEMNPTTRKKQAINQVMIVGGFAKVGGVRCTAHNTAEILDFSNGLDNISRSQINLAETGGRGHPNVVPLPDSSLFALGGIKKFNEESSPCPTCVWHVTTPTNDLVLTTERIRYISGSWTSPGFDAGMDGSDRDGECQPGWKTPDGVRIYHSGGFWVRTAR